MPVFAISPGVYSQEQDLSAGVQATATTIASAVFASPKGSLIPFFSSSRTAFLQQFGPPNLAFGYGHHSCLAFLLEGANLWSSRVVDNALYGVTSFVGNYEGVANTTQYNRTAVSGSVYDYTKAYIDIYSLIFDRAIVSGMTYTATYSAVGADTLGDIVNVSGTVTQVFSQNNNTTLNLLAAAINTALGTAISGAGYAGVLPVIDIPAFFVDDGTHANFRAIHVAGAQGLVINLNVVASYTGGVVVSNTTLPLVTYQDTKLFDVFAVDPGVWNNTIACKITNTDLGTPQRGQIIFAGPILTGNTITVTVTDLTTGITNTNTSSPLAFSTSSNYTLTALASLLSAAPYNLSATVVNVLGSTSGSRVIKIIAPNAYSNISMTVVVNLGTGASNTTALYNKTINAITPNNTFTFSVFTTDDVVNAKETFIVSMAHQQDGFGAAQNIADVINLGPKKSKYIRIYQPASSLTALFTNNSSTLYLLAGGSDGATVTSADLINGWTNYDSREKVEMRMMINCGYTLTGLQQYMDSIAQLRKDCIAILDVPSVSQSPADAVDFRNNTINLNSSYSALYTPDLLIQDSYSNRQLYIPPSGYIAGVYARTDRVAATWFAPAGLNRADLSSKIIGLRYDYNLGDRNLLFPAQVNWIQKIPGKGYPVNSAETLQARSSALSNVNVRRLLIFMEVSIVDALIYYQWEPNDDITRSQIETVVTNFARPIKLARGLKDFLVVSDDTNNSSNDEDEGVLNVQILVKPIIPAKFIRLLTTITSAGANFQELVAAG